MKLTIDTDVCKRKAQALSLELVLFITACCMRLKLLCEIAVMLAKAGYYRMFFSQIYTASNIDVDGFRNVYELEGYPSVTPGFVRLQYRQTVNGHEKARSSMLVTVQEWNAVARRVAFGSGRLAQAD
ncbi:TPA: hypothetical protein ACNV18_000217 [Pseudomonas putida]|uniref:Uncharacterized protein n=4 Tax=Pseudomonas TaxID=286 RepID=A0A2A3M1W2_PSEDL|nr:MULTISPECIES: hypothetical protein [Pseudomonas]TXG99556.1 MAG: hypothetical protein E6R08_01815 [Nevskiaceae bacterium]AGZ38245.1 hypothetical protein PVLB_27542 [Pseudomonas sp. VLB120]EKT4481304.1 hypothetical protein [Pseudomonas putida]MBA6061041.1 hypothetical protein [Pseudomonas juntendi]MCE0945638.1 hypothetical protein [Pseudomonas asiatica]